MTALKIDFSSYQLSLLRSDHAGEIGAVNIYKGILWCAKDPVVLAFANCHLEVESRHLESVESILTPENRSIFSPLWILAGRVLGGSKLPVFDYRQCGRVRRGPLRTTASFLPWVCPRAHTGDDVRRRNAPGGRRLPLLKKICFLGFFG